MRHERAQEVRGVGAEPVRVRPHGATRPHPAQRILQGQPSRRRR